MKKSILIVFILFVGLNVFGQRRRNTNNIPQTNREPTEQEIAKREREIKARKDEYISNFLTTLEADEFQKHIIKQKVNTFYDSKIEILKKKFEHSIDRETAIKKLEDTHFLELSELISVADMAKIKEMITGGFNEKEVVKKKKKKRKRNKKQKQKNDNG